MIADAGDGLRAIASLARQVPDFAARTQRLSEEIDKMAISGLRFDAETADAIGKAEARHSRSGRWALWVIALSVLYIAHRLA